MDLSGWIKNKLFWVSFNLKVEIVISDPVMGWVPI